MRLPRRLRIVLATRPLAYWSLTVAVAVVAGAVVEQAVAGAADARHRWGEATPVLVATRPMAAGTLLDASDSELRAVPIALVPAEALTTRPPGTVPLAGPVSAGEIITTGRVGRGGRSAIAALLPEGRRGVAVPRPDGLTLRVGDEVDVAGASGLLTSGALVLDVNDSAAVVAVAAADAPAVARAAAAGDAVPVLAG